MNRIYKVVWNEARNCYVVASELAKKQTKGCGKKMLAAVLAAGIFSVTGAGSAWADNVVVDASNDTGKNTVTAGSKVTLVGTGNEVNGSDNNEVFGNGNKILIADMGSQNVGIFGALNTVTDADTMYVTGYQNTAKSIFTSV